MRSRQGLLVAARQTAEFLAFGLGLVIPLWASRGLTFSIWQGVLIVGTVYLAIGAIPLPWERRASLVAVASFLVPLGILGYVAWDIEYFMFFQRSGAWQNLPRVLLSPENLGVAVALCGSAVVGTMLGRKVRATR